MISGISPFAANSNASVSHACQENSTSVCGSCCTSRGAAASSCYIAPPTGGIHHERRPDTRRPHSLNRPRVAVDELGFGYLVRTHLIANVDEAVAPRAWPAPQPSTD